MEEGEGRRKEEKGGREGRKKGEEMRRMRRDKCLNAATEPKEMKGHGHL